jgi:hypothetical protein
VAATDVLTVTINVGFAVCVTEGKRRFFARASFSAKLVADALIAGSYLAGTNTRDGNPPRIGHSL